VYPNPASSGATIEFTLELPISLRIEIYDVQGRQVRLTETAPLSKGHHRIPLETLGLASGLYVYRLVDASGRAATGRLIVR
jgi:hypothetical protein